MHLEPVEIQHVKLRRGLIGYQREAVDQLLENVTASYEDVWFERAKLEAELASLRNRLDGQAQAKEALEGSVKVAQSTADDLLADARAKADSVVDEAHQRALATIRETREEHQRLQVEIKKLEVSETEITLRLRALLTAARELLDGHESIRELASQTSSDDRAAAARTRPPAPPASNGTKRSPDDVAAESVTSQPEDPAAVVGEKAQIPPRPAAPTPEAPATAEAAQPPPATDAPAAAAAAVTAAITSSRGSEPRAPERVEAPVAAPAEAPASASPDATDDEGFSEADAAGSDARRVGPDPAVVTRAEI